MTRAPVGLDAVTPPDAPFDEPWQARAFALAVVTVDRLGLPWDAFRDELKAAIAARPGAPYFDCWLDALEAIVAAHPAAG